MSVKALKPIKTVSFDDLPDSAFVRVSQLTNHARRPVAPVPLPFSEPTLWRKVKAGSFPKPTKLSARVTAWRVADVRGWIATQINLGSGE